jgi:hypothetical protein
MTAFLFIRGIYVKRLSNLITDDIVTVGLCAKAIINASNKKWWKTVGSKGA